MKTFYNLVVSILIVKTTSRILCKLEHLLEYLHTLIIIFFILTCNNITIVNYSQHLHLTHINLKYRFNTTAFGNKHKIFRIQHYMHSNIWQSIEMLFFYNVLGIDTIKNICYYIFNMPYLYKKHFCSDNQGHTRYVMSSDG